MTVTPLTTARVHRLVQALPDLVGTRPSDGNPPDKWRGVPIGELLRDYYRVLEIAHFVRRGGVKAMIYRLETGKAALTSFDYFDEAHQRLAVRFQNIYKPEEISESCLVHELKNISAEEEEAVKEVMPQLDAFLLLQKRQQALEVDGPVA